MLISFSKPLRINWGALKTIALQLAVYDQFKVSLLNPKSQKCCIILQLYNSFGKWGWTLWTLDSLQQWSFLRHCWLRGRSCICLLDPWKLLREIFGKFHHCQHTFQILMGTFESIWNVSWCRRSKNGLQNTSHKIIWCVKKTNRTRETFPQRRQ